MLDRQRLLTVLHVALLIFIVGYTTVALLIYGATDISRYSLDAMQNRPTLITDLSPSMIGLSSVFILVSIFFMPGIVLAILTTHAVTRGLPSASMRRTRLLLLLFGGVVVFALSTYGAKLATWLID